MFTSTEKANSASTVTQFDVSAVVTLRERVSRAATSLKLIGFLSAIGLLLFLSNHVGFLTALLCAMGLSGLVDWIAKRLRSGNVRAAIVAAAWSLLILFLSAFDQIPKSLRNGLDTYTILGSLLILLPVLFVLRGLRALLRYRPTELAGDGGAKLLAYPWEEGLKIMVRPNFINKRSGFAIVFLLLSPLPYFVLLASQFQGDVRFASDTSSQFGEFVGASLVTLGIFAWCTKIYRRARREAMLPGSALVKKDARPIVLYLRSFHDDSGLLLRARATNGRILPERLVRVSFEEVVTDHLWGYGPVLAIGDPQTKAKTALLGAARDYAKDCDWQDRVVELMQQASIVVAIAGQTKGLVWEMETVVSRGFISKFVLLLPPVKRKESEARWEFLANNAASLNLPSGIELATARAVIFPQGKAILISGDKRNDWTYEAVLDEAMLAILDTLQKHPAKSASNVTQTGRFFRELARELPSIARSALAFVAIGAFLLLVDGLRLNHMNLSHPYKVPGELRDDFVGSVEESCKGKDDARRQFCACYANRIADSVTYGEVQALSEAKTRTLQGESEFTASSQKKMEAANSACSAEMLVE